jgi:hypothetical protein
MKRNKNIEIKLKHLAIDTGGTFRTLGDALGVTDRTIQNVIYGICSKSLAVKIEELSKGKIKSKEARWDY